MRESVNHPAHYGGKDNPTEAIKVIEAHGLGFNLGNAVKYILRSGKKDREIEDLNKAAWYLQRHITNRTPKPTAEPIKTRVDVVKPDGSRDSRHGAIVMGCDFGAGDSVSVCTLAVGERAERIVIGDTTIEVPVDLFRATAQRTGKLAAKAEQLAATEQYAKEEAAWWGYEVVRLHRLGFNVQRVRGTHHDVLVEHAWGSEMISFTGSHPSSLRAALVEAVNAVCDRMVVLGYSPNGAAHNARKITPGPSRASKGVEVDVYPIDHLGPLARALKVLEDAEVVRIPFKHTDFGFRWRGYYGDGHPAMVTAVQSLRYALADPAMVTAVQSLRYALADRGWVHTRGALPALEKAITACDTAITLLAPRVTVPESATKSPGKLLTPKPEPKLASWVEGAVQCMLKAGGIVIEWGGMGGGIRLTWLTASAHGHDLRKACDMLILELQSGDYRRFAQEPFSTIRMLRNAVKMLTPGAQLEGGAK